ncbi:unnamed protein product [Diabrotica balteata]|uniref:GPI inositol-deacylase n=1 Tax=Diabrotica balteata TaxID=107213 RepID=A0A9N9TC73_DIABA|nr:unnamed protein product [Diabrotica balteata]
MKKISIYVFVSLILACSYIIGILKFLSENEEDRCEMTYMFEYPQYVKISNKADKEFRKYGLYAYSEGRLTERTRNMYFDGIPVLFIPGNAGSHKQVRSLSSVALRKWLNSRTSYHFDYFAVDLNEEYSGLYGPLLFDQLRYVNASLHRVLELYEDRQQPPESVVVVGHSMGGIIAMKLLSELEQPELISVLITLASPLKRPALSLDYHMNKFYEGIFDEDFSKTTVVSLEGGYKDILMHPHFTKRENNDIIHVSTSHIPMSWTESNHVQILWCKQVVMALNRALFDSVNMKTRLISTNATYRKHAFKHHLIKNSGTKVKDREQYSKLVTINTKGKWIDDIRKTYSIDHARGLNEPHWNMVALSDLPGYEILSVLAVNLEVTDWIFACNAYYIKQTSRACVQSSLFGVLGQLARTYTPLLITNLAVIALMSLRHQLITLENGYCSIIFTAIQEGAKPYYVFCAYVLLTRLLSIPFLPDILLKPDHIHLVGDGVDFFLVPLFLYTCSVGFFWILIVFFSVSLIAMESTVHKLSLKLLARSVSFNMAWSDYLMSYLHKLTQMSQDFVEEIVWFIGKKIARGIKRFFSRKKNKPENQIVAITPIEDTNKHISVQHNIKQITGAQGNESEEDVTEDDTEKHLESEETEETDIDALESDMIDNSVETDDQKHKIVQAQCELKDKETETNPEIGVQVKLEENDGFSKDAATSKSENAFTEENAIKKYHLKEKPVQNMSDGDITKDLNLNQSSNSNETEEKTNVDSQLLQISAGSAGKHETSANEVKDRSKDERTGDPELSSAYNAIFFHSTLFFLWCIITVINVPAVLTWAHNFKYNTVLEADDSFIPGFTLSICSLILWQFELPRTNR